jgi:hypothetical protein
MKRRLFLALPAALPAPAAAFRLEEADAALRADLAATCDAAQGAHEELRAMLDRLAAGQTMQPEALRRLATCPFCACRVGWVPPSETPR